MPLGIVRDVMLAVKRGIQGILVGPTQITTSTAATATAYSNQRKIDRTSNGVLWTAFSTGIANLSQRFAWYYSLDNGSTWVGPSYMSSGGGSASNYTDNISFFIDQDDYAHVVFKDNYNGYIYYRRGTPNAARTAWTWSAAIDVSTANNGNALNYPDVVAHREGTGWVVHVVASRVAVGTYPLYVKLTVSSSNAITRVSQNALGTGAQTGDSYPSIDFNHTGDGKTVAGGTPHLYVAWSAGTTGAGKGIRFIKGTYSAGAWTWGTDREIDSTRYVSVPGCPIACLFDGTAVRIFGCLYVSGSNYPFMIYQRDAADTTTTTLYSSDLTGGVEGAFGGSFSYDADRNLYIVGRAYDSTVLNIYKFVSSTNTMTKLGTLAFPHAGTNEPFVSMKRGYSNSRIEFIYTDGTASPYSVKYGAIK